MSTLILYYSLSGHSAAYAKNLAKTEGAAIAELKDAAPTGKFKAYTKGSLLAITGKAWPILPFDGKLQAAFAEAERLIVVCPIWGGNVPPAVNAMLADLPEGKAVEFKLLSGSGKSSCADKLKEKVAARGCTLAGIEDIQA